MNIQIPSKNTHKQTVLYHGLQWKTSYLGNTGSPVASMQIPTQDQLVSPTTVTQQATDQQNDKPSLFDGDISMVWTPHKYFLSSAGDEFIIRGDNTFGSVRVCVRPFVCGRSPV